MAAGSHGSPHASVRVAFRSTSMLFFILVSYSSKIHICMVVHASVGIGYVVPTGQTQSGFGFNIKNCTVQGLGGIIGLRHLLLSV